MNVSQGTSKWSANFQLKSKMSRSPDVKNVKKLPHIWLTCLLTCGGSSAGGSGADCKLGLTIVSPNLLSTPETLGSANGRTASYHVGTAPTSVLVDTNIVGGQALHVIWYTLRQ